MPTFVPVVDSETPRLERDDADMAKHRQWDSTVIARSAASMGKGGVGKGGGGKGGGGKAGASGLTSNRGWGTGTVGWGVQGKFGSNEADVSDNVQKRYATGKNKMIRNSKGLWVKAKDVEDDGESADLGGVNAGMAQSSSTEPGR